ncbi:hypothetical protein ACN08Y_10205 [Rothia sp. P5764]|uniref:hypothetical protein n=1 Tax=Rothia sp. P5764 TaxID=3402654 RepID=UPI003AD185D1
MSSKVSLPILSEGKFTGRALAHINELADGKVGELETKTFEAIGQKADQSTFDTFLNTVSNQISDSEARTALAGAQAAISAERTAREEADARLAGRLTAIEEAEPDLNGLASAEDLALTDARVSALEKKPAAGIYIDAYGREQKYVFVTSDVEPEKTKIIDGVTYEVWWVQTTPPDPSQHVPAQIKMDAATRSYVVPKDAGATYQIDGVPKSAGTYTVPGMGEATVQWAAVPKPGFSFKAGATVSGTLRFPVKTFVPGDVMMSDSFDRADGPLGGSSSDSFAGGIPYAWKSTGSVPAMIVSGYVTPGSSMVAGLQTYAEYTLPAEQQKLYIEYTPRPVASKPCTYTITLYTADGNVQLRGDNKGVSVVTLVTGSTQLTALTTVSVAVGDKVRFTYDTSAPKLVNLTTGQEATYVGSDPSRFRLTGKASSIKLDLRHELSAIGDIKVGIPA